MDIIDNNKKMEDAADHVIHRTHEVDAYDTNIATYKAMLETLPTEWPVHLAHLKDLPQEQALVECDLDDIETVVQLHLRNRVAYLVRTEIQERTKAEHFRKVAEASLPAKDKDLLLSNAIKRKNAL